MALLAADSVGKEQSFVTNDIIIQMQTLFLVVSSPIGECPLDIWEFPLVPLHRRSAAIVRVKILILLTQNLRYGAKEEDQYNVEVQRGRVFI